MNGASPFVERGPWLFGAKTDLAVFGGSAILALALVAIGAPLGLLHVDSPEWIWLACILGIDVAHVWSTSFRVYLDPSEVRRRPLLYLGLPVLCYALGVLVHAFASHAFWTALAYLAVFHFVRQQAGWVKLYQRRQAVSRFDRALDLATVYVATLYPILWWHGHLPRQFHWFLEGDFIVTASGALSDALMPVYWGIGGVYLARQVFLAARGELQVGKALVVVTTWACWYVGIIALDSDYAFTVTNVLIHGIPYLALTFRYGRARAKTSDAMRRVLRGGLVAFLATVVIAAFLEELFWDRYVWHERSWLFGEGVTLEGLALTFVVPLLALPQAVHYALDGFVWRRRGNV